jgi:phage terminase large subunit-like protein
MHPFAKHPRPLTALAKLRAYLPLMQRDINAFLPFVFNNLSAAPFVQADLHRELQRFLDDHPRALIELPRDHGKTTQICGRILWELGRNPTLRVKVVCATDIVAGERVKFLRDAIERNLRLRLVFPELKLAGLRQADRFTLERPGEGIGPSVAAFGIGSGSTGTRADLLVCDDIVDAKSIASAADRDVVRRLFENTLMNLLEPDGRFWGLSTPYHDDDLNARLKANPSFALFRRAIDANFTPVWPQHWPSERLAARHREIGDTAFARGYRLVPVAEEGRLIDRDWIRTWTERSPYDRIVAAVDPAASLAERADRTAIVVLGQTADGLIDCLYAEGRRIRIVELVDWLRAVHAEYRMTRVLYEANGAFAGVFEEVLRNMDGAFTLEKITATARKADRVSVLAMNVKSGRFRVAATGQAELIVEMTDFPHGKHDDLADAAAMAVAHLRETRPIAIW